MASNIIPPHFTFRQALQRGFVEVRSRPYMDAVKRLPCVACNAPADDPHHPHGVGFRGAGTKTPDLWVIPLCRKCHDELHYDVHAWEQRYGSQFEFVALTFLRLWTEGKLVLNKEVA